MVAKLKKIVPEGLLPILPFFAAVHFGLMIYDWYQPEVFLNADRADYRFRTIIGFVNSTDVIQYLSTHGLIGDYIFQAVAFIIGGKFSVIVTQVLLNIVSIVFVYRISFLLTESRLTSQLSVFVYFFLPHTLAYPHLLASESLSNPLTIISIYYLVLHFSTQRASDTSIVLSGLFIAISMLIRPIVLFFPIFVYCVLKLFEKNGKPATRFKYLSAAYLPVILWMTFMLVTTGAFSLGSSGSTLGLNLYQKVERMQQALPKPQDNGFLDDLDAKSLSVSEYAGFIADHPKLAVNLLKYDISNLLINSGSNKLFSYYLEIYAADKRQSSAWRKTIDKRGLISGILEVVSESGTYVIFTIISTAVWVTIFFGSVLGAIIFWKTRSQMLAEKLIVLGYPLYVITFTLALVSYPRSGHRSSFDFIVAIMFSYLVTSLLLYAKTRANAGKRAKY